MANVIKIKRSAVSGKVPTTAQLELGELAVNTYDGKLYTKKDDGTAAVVEIGAASGIADGDKGDITVSSSGTTWTIDSGVVTSAKIADGTIVNGDISASAAIADSKLGTISTAGKVSNSATTATNLNTASAIVARDASGNFSAGTITAALSGNATTSSSCSGNAATASALATARSIGLGGDLSGSASFDGSANITITATVADDSHAHVIGNVDGLQTALDAKAALASPTFTGTPAAPTAAVGTNTTQLATTAFVNSEIANDAPTKTGGGASGTWGISVTGSSASCTGNAATATTLQTARTINGVSFNGSANITVEAYIENDEATNATRYLTFVDNTTASYKRLNEDSSLTYNPSTNTLVAGTFSGALSGNATTATTLQTTRSINGTNFNGSANITTSYWGTTRTVTVGNTGKSVNGSGNVSWSLAEIGALALTGGTVTGDISMSGTGTIKVPVGTTAQRPTAVQGMIRFNTSRGCFEGYTGSAWVNMSPLNIDDVGAT